MKSIHEVAEAYGKEHQGTVNIEDFEAGANFVLEQVESILPFVAKKGIIYGKIKETIEQLKSNQ